MPESKWFEDGQCPTNDLPADCIATLGPGPRGQECSICWTDEIDTDARTVLHQPCQNVCCLECFWYNFNSQTRKHRCFKCRIEYRKPQPPARCYLVAHGGQIADILDPKRLDLIGGDIQHWLEACQFASEIVERAQLQREQKLLRAFYDLGQTYEAIAEPGDAEIEQLVHDTIPQVDENEDDDYKFVGLDNDSLGFLDADLGSAAKNELYEQEHIHPPFELPWCASTTDLLTRAQDLRLDQSELDTLWIHANVFGTNEWEFAHPFEDNDVRTFYMPCPPILQVHSDLAQIANVVAQDSAGRAKANLPSILDIPLTTTTIRWFIRSTGFAGDAAHDTMRAFNDIARRSAATQWMLVTASKSVQWREDRLLKHHICPWPVDADFKAASTRFDIKSLDNGGFDPALDALCCERFTQRLATENSQAQTEEQERWQYWPKRNFWKYSGELLHEDDYSDQSSDEEAW